MTCAPRPPLVRLAFGFVAAGWLGLSNGCAWTGMSDSRRAVVFPEDEELALGEKAFDQAIVTRAPSQNMQQKQLVEQVGNRLAQASEHAGWPWQFLLVRGEKPEAVCLPGGKMIVSEGMVARCGNEAGLAAVMSHEIAHVVAHHGNQRMADQMAHSGRSWLKPWKRNVSADAKQEMIQASYGLTPAGNEANPFSSVHEAEADSIGLKIMAKAGYDPREAPRAWERLAHGERQDRPEFAHLHPADTDRTKKLSNLMPTALAYYAQSPQLGVGVAIAAPPTETPKRGVTLASHTQPGDKRESVAQASHVAADAKGATRDEKKPDEKKLVRTADNAVSSNDPFLGSPKPAGMEPPVAAAPVALRPVEEPSSKPSSKSTRFAAYAPGGESATGDDASPRPLPGTGPAAAPADSEARSDEPKPVPTNRWAKPVPVSADGPPRVPRPTIDLSETPPPEQDDNWRTAREPRSNPFAER